MVRSIAATQATHAELVLSVTRQSGEGVLHGIAGAGNIHRGPVCTVNRVFQIEIFSTIGQPLQIHTVYVGLQDGQLFGYVSTGGELHIVNLQFTSADHCKVNSLVFVDFGNWEDDMLHLFGGSAFVNGGETVLGRSSV